MLHKSIWKWQRHRNFISGIIIRLEHFDFGIMEDDLELHLNSSHQQASDRARSTVLGGSMEFEEESGAGNVQVNSCNEVEGIKGYLNEKKHTLNNSHTGYVGNLSRIHNKITRLMENGGTQDEISKEMENFNDGWTKLMDVHDRYCKCLVVGVDTPALEKAEKGYK